MVAFGLPEYRYAWKETIYSAESTVLMGLYCVYQQVG